MISVFHIVLIYSFKHRCIKIFGFQMQHFLRQLFPLINAVLNQVNMYGILKVFEIGAVK